MSKTKKTTTAKPAPIQCNNTACKFRGLTGFCFAHPGDECPEGKIKPAQVQESPKVKEPTPAPGKTLEERIKERAAKMGINPAKVIVSTVSAAPVKVPSQEPVKAEEKPSGHEPAPVVKKALRKINTAMERKPKPVKAQEPVKAPEPVKKSPYTDHLADWKDDTARNLHTEVRIKIATWCVTNATAEVEEFALILEDLEYIASLDMTPELQDFRCYLDGELIERIGRVFGREAAFAINGCL